MTKQKGSSRSFLLVGLVIILILAIALIRLDKRTAAIELVEETPVVVVSKPKPTVSASVAQPIQYRNTLSKYSVTVPAGSNLMANTGQGLKSVTTLPADAHEVYFEKDGAYFSAYTQAAPYGMGIYTKRTQGTATVGDKVFRTSGWLEEYDGKTSTRDMVYVRDDLTLYFGHTSTVLTPQKKAAIEAFKKSVLTSVSLK